MLDNKRGIGTDVILIIIFIFTVALGIGFYSINEKVKGNQLTIGIETQKGILAGHEVLVDYLKSPDEKWNNKAELISNAIAGKNYELIKKDATGYFNKKLVDVNWYLEFKDSSRKLIFPAVYGTRYSPEEQFASAKKVQKPASITIPINGLNQGYVLIELYFVV